MTDLQTSKLADQVERTNKLIVQLENQRYLQMVDRPFKFLFMSFLQGLAAAFGSTVGLALVIWVVALILRRFGTFSALSDQLNHFLDSLQKISTK